MHKSAVGNATILELFFYLNQIHIPIVQLFVVIKLLKWMTSPYLLETLDLPLELKL